MENSSEEEKQRILDTYEPAPLHESDSEGDDTPDVPLVSYAAALEGLETLCRFRLQNPHVNAQKGEQLEAFLYREKGDIEGLQGMAQGRKQQSTITDFLGPRSDNS